MKRAYAATLVLGAVAGLFASGQSATAGTVFSDNFSSSTVDSATPGAPTASSTDYEIASTKNALSLASISSGHLVFGLPATTSGAVEMQALFPLVTLSSIGDYVDVTMVFSESGILNSANTSSASLNVGLYNSGGVAPLAGGVLANSGLSSSTTYNRGGTQLWDGDAARILQTGSEAVFTRPQQNGGTANDNNGNQDLVFNGSVTGSYKNPTGATLGTSSLGTTLALTDGSTYTLDYKLTLSAPGALTISDSLYSGSGVNPGNLIFSQTGTDSSAPSTSFDGMSLGWRYAGSSGASSVSMDSISVSAVPEPSILALAGLGLAGLLAGVRRRAGR